MDLASTCSCSAPSADWLAFPASPRAEAGVQGGDAGLVRRDAALRGGQVGGQGVYARSGGPGSPAAWACREATAAAFAAPPRRCWFRCPRCWLPCRLGACRRQHGGELAGRDAGDLGGPPIVQDVPRDGALE